MLEGQEQQVSSQSFIDAFEKSWKETQGGTKKLKTQISVSPIKLSERWFYWNAEFEDGTVVNIKVPLPKLWLSNAFSSLFLTAFNFLFTEEVAKEMPAPEEVDPEVFKAYRGSLIEKARLSQQGVTILKYMFYLLFKQDSGVAREVVEEAEQREDFTIIISKIPFKDVERCIREQLEGYGLVDADAILNLVPLALDLYLYVNGLRKGTSKEISDEATEKKAAGLGGWL